LSSLPVKVTFDSADHSFKKMATQNHTPGVLSTARPLLRQNLLRVLLIAAPGLTAAVAILTATAGNFALTAVLNVAAGVVISSALFVAVSFAAGRVTEERVNLMRAAERGFWRARFEMVAIQDEESGLHTDWYFRLRLQEEIDRSKRYSLQFALMVIRPFAVHQEIDIASAKAWFGEHIQRHLRKSDLAAMLQDGAIAILMTNTELKAATSVERRVRKDLAQVDPRVGIAAFPRDGETPDGIVNAAARAASQDVHAAA
jgi:GGDEF domain-containing protein